MTLTPLILMLVACWPGGAESPPISQWLDATRIAESGGNRLAIGDTNGVKGGWSRGPYQIQRETWRVFHGREPWATFAHDEFESRRVARRYLLAAVRECRRRGWRVSYANVRHLYRYGLHTHVKPQDEK